MTQRSVINWNARNNAWSDAILNAGRFPDLLEELGVRLKGNRDRLIYRAPCPVHGGDDHNFEVRVGGHSMPIRWACYSHDCHKQYKGSLLGLVRGVLSAQQDRKVGLTQVEGYLKAFLGHRPSAEARPRPSPPRPQLPSWSRERVRRQLQIPSPYFLARGFTPAVLDRHDVGFSARQGKSIVPLYADDGASCIGFVARSQAPRCPDCRKHHWPDRLCRYAQPKWKVADGFPSETHVYNFHTALQSASPAVLVVEGPCDVWRAEEAGYLAVAILGHELFPEQHRKLLALQKHIFLALDNDEAGQKGLARATELFSIKGGSARPLFLPASCTDLADMPRDVAAQFLAGVLGSPTG